MPTNRINGSSRWFKTKSPVIVFLNLFNRWGLQNLHPEAFAVHCWPWSRLRRIRSTGLKRKRLGTAVGFRFKREGGRQSSLQNDFCWGICASEITGQYRWSTVSNFWSPWRHFHLSFTHNKAADVELQSLRLFFFLVEIFLQSTSSFSTLKCRLRLLRNVIHTNPEVCMRALDSQVFAKISLSWL